MARFRRRPYRRPFSRRRSAYGGGLKGFFNSTRKVRNAEGNEAEKKRTLFNVPGFIGQWGRSTTKKRENKVIGKYDYSNCPTCDYYDKKDALSLFDRRDGGNLHMSPTPKRRSFRVIPENKMPHGGLDNVFPTGEENPYDDRFSRTNIRGNREERKIRVIGRGSIRPPSPTPVVVRNQTRRNRILPTRVSAEDPFSFNDVYPGHPNTFSIGRSNIATRRGVENQDVPIGPIGEETSHRRLNGILESVRKHFTRKRIQPEKPATPTRKNSPGRNGNSSAAASTRRMFPSIDTPVGFTSPVAKEYAHHLNEKYGRPVVDATGTKAANSSVERTI